MRYQVVIVPMPGTPKGVQDLIDAAVPADFVLVSASPFTRDGSAQLLIVYTAKPTAPTS